MDDVAAPRRRSRQNRCFATFAGWSAAGWLIGIGVIALPAAGWSAGMWVLAGLIAISLLWFAGPSPAIFGVVAGAGTAALLTLFVVNVVEGRQEACVWKLLGTSFQCGGLEVAPWPIVGLALVAVGGGAFWIGRRGFQP